MSSTLGSDFWKEGLKLLSFCPICEARSQAMNARLIGVQEETHLLHVQCKKCKHSVLAMVALNQTGVSSLGLLTDLSYEDVLRCTSQEQVTVNDVIEIHEYLESSKWGEWLTSVSKKQLNKVVTRRKNYQKKSQKNQATQ